MYILGISCYYHDSSAALLKDGRVIAAAEEERFTRKKHDSSFPTNAIEYCLKSQNIDISRIKYIGFYEKPILKFERILHQYLQVFPFGLKSFVNTMPSWINQKTRVTQTIRKKLKFKNDILFVDHHMAHAASAFLVSPYQEAAIVTIDGVGEWSTTTYGVGKKNDINLVKQIQFPHSIGLFYSTITAYLGFRVNDAEYKVMGLSAYGEKDKRKNKYYQKLLRTIDIKNDGSYQLKMEYFSYLRKETMPSKKMCKLLGGPIRESDSFISTRHKDIAAAVQLVYEDVFLKILKNVRKETGMDKLVIAGGCGLNSVANGKILANTTFKSVWIQPNSSDGGASIGAAAYVYHTILGNKRKYFMSDAYLGPKYSAREIREFLDENEIKYTIFKSVPEIAKTTAKLIYQNNVVGWFQIGMEFGPRALGARSILANPCNLEMRDILNEKVKHREVFRPFAPAVCENDVKKYFECDDPTPTPSEYMLMVYPVKEKYRKKIPSVVHVDGSCRLQTVKRNHNKGFYDLIKEFGKLSGISVLINTSFNIQGEPIVCSPYDAYRCMMGTNIDYLVINNFLIKRSDNLRDIWESEKNVKKKPVIE